MVDDDTKQQNSQILDAKIWRRKDLEKERGGKGRSTEEGKGGRSWPGLGLRCFRNTTVVTTVVKSQKLVFGK